MGNTGLQGKWSSKWCVHICVWYHW